MIECPACGGPPEERAFCETCGGSTEVTQEVYDAFLAQKEKQERFFEFQSSVTEKIANGIDSNMSFTIDEEIIEYLP